MLRRMKLSLEDHERLARDVSVCVKLLASVASQLRGAVPKSSASQRAANRAEDAACGLWQGLESLYDQECAPFPDGEQGNTPYRMALDKLTTTGQPE